VYEFKEEDFKEEDNI